MLNHVLVRFRSTGRRYRCKASRNQPIWIREAQRIPADIGIGVDPAREADGVAFDIAARSWIVVAESIVMQFRALRGEA